MFIQAKVWKMCTSCFAKCLHLRKLERGRCGCRMLSWGGRRILNFVQFSTFFQEPHVTSLMKMSNNKGEREIPAATRAALASRECVQEGKTSDVMLPSSGTNENLQEPEKRRSSNAECQRLQP